MQDVPTCNNKVPECCCRFYGERVSSNQIVHTMRMVLFVLEHMRAPAIMLECTSHVLIASALDQKTAFHPLTTVLTAVGLFIVSIFFFVMHKFAQQTVNCHFWQFCASLSLQCGGWWRWFSVVHQILNASQRHEDNTNVATNQQASCRLQELLPEYKDSYTKRQRSSWPNQRRQWELRRRRQQACCDNLGRRGPFVDHHSKTQTGGWDIQ